MVAGGDSTYIAHDAGFLSYRLASLFSKYICTHTFCGGRVVDWGR